MKQRRWSYNFGLPAAAAEDMLAAGALTHNYMGEHIQPRIFQKC